MQALDTLEALEALPVKIDYVGEVPSKWDADTPRTVDQWRVTLSSKAGFHSFDYYTGLGLRARNKPKAPKVADVLHSLVLDASAADENFHDWCANYGYSDDSIKAMNAYKACLEVAAALRKHFPPDTLRTVRELLRDY